MNMYEVAGACVTTVMSQIEILQPEMFYKTDLIGGKIVSIYYEQNYVVTYKSRQKNMYSITQQLAVHML